MYDKYAVGNHYGSTVTSDLTEAYLLYLLNTKDGSKAYLMNQTQNEIIINNQEWKNTPNKDDRRRLEHIESLVVAVREL